MSLSAAPSPKKHCLLTNSRGGKQWREEKVVPLTHKCHVIQFLVQLPRQHKSSPATAQDHYFRFGWFSKTGCVDLFVSGQSFDEGGGRGGGGGGGIGGRESGFVFG